MDKTKNGIRYSLILVGTGTYIVEVEMPTYNGGRLKTACAEILSSIRRKTMDEDYKLYEGRPTIFKGRSMTINGETVHEITGKYSYYIVSNLR